MAHPIVVDVVFRLAVPARHTWRRRLVSYVLRRRIRHLTGLPLQVRHVHFVFYAIAFAISLAYHCRYVMCTLCFMPSHLPYHWLTTAGTSFTRWVLCRSILDSARFPLSTLRIMSTLYFALLEIVLKLVRVHDAVVNMRQMVAVDVL